MFFVGVGFKLVIVLQKVQEVGEYSVLLLILA